MDKTWVKDVKEGERLKSVFLVSRKAVPTAKSGKTYLSITLVDKTGELEARAFERVDELSSAFEEKGYVEVEGPVGTFQGKVQLKIESAAKPPDPAALDAAEFAWAPPPEPKKPEKPAPAEQDDPHWRELLGLVEAITDANVKALVKAFVEDDDVAARLRRAPAAKSIHHAYAGGLLEHTVSCLKLSHRLADHYPQVDRDLLVAGAFFHDLGKIRELSGERNAEYTDEGRLVGHHVMTAQWVHDKCRRLGLPRDLEHHVVHLVLAHHGKLEYGSPKTPMTLEALLTHHVDELDSRVNSWLGLMAKEGGSRRWTSADNVYEQPIWRGALPTVQAEKKAPPAELLTPVIYVPREGGGGPGGGAQRKPGQKPKERRREPAPAPAGEARAEGAAAAAEARPQGAPAPHEPRPPRPERHDRPQRADRPDRREHRGPGGPGGPGGGPGGFGDRKRGYQGPRLPGDTGPHRPSERKSLTHNPFAALAAKLEGAGAEEPRSAAPAEEPVPPAAEAAPAEPVEAHAAEPAPESREATPAAPAEPPAPEAKPTEGA
jgi:3'-5' exoribonuclease